MGEGWKGKREEWGRGEGDGMWGKVGEVGEVGEGGQGVHHVGFNLCGPVGFNPWAAPVGFNDWVPVGGSGKYRVAARRERRRPRSVSRLR